MNGLPEHTVRMWFPWSVRTYRVLELAERGDWTLSLVRTGVDEHRPYTYNLACGDMR